MDMNDTIHKIETMNPNSLFHFLENSPEAIKSFSSLLSSLSAKKLDNESALRSYIIDSSEDIIQIFISIANIKAELLQSKRNFSSISNQMIILKKKYIEPFNKLIKSISTKANIDNVISLHNNIKSFKTDIKVLRTHFDQNTLTISESIYHTYLRLKRSQLIQFAGITVIKDDLEWFNANDNEIQSKFRSHFNSSILASSSSSSSSSNGNTNTDTVLLFFHFYSQMNTLVNEIKNFANKILNDLIKENLFKTIIKGVINEISPLDMIYDNVLKVRKELDTFFAFLESYSKQFVRLGHLLNSHYDKKHFILYESIMETEDLQDINRLFIKSVFSSLTQIFTTIASNPKNSNSYSYFIKDYIFVYFSIKRLCLFTCKNYEEYSALGGNQNCLKGIKSDFLNKFKVNLTENVTRAFVLVKNIEQNAEANGQFDKENIVNVHIIDHLVDYIKKLSQGFTDLYDEFAYVIDNTNVNANGTDIETGFFSNKDPLICELQVLFSEAILDNYFMMIFSKLDTALASLQLSSSSSSSITNPNNEILQVQKFYFFYYILYKMNDVFINFLNSNVSYLINESLVNILSNKMDYFMNQFYTTLLNRLSLKILLINKDVFQNYIDLLSNLVKQVKLFLAKEHYNNNRAFEKPIMKFVIYLYSLGSVLLLMLNCKSEFEAYDNFINELTEVTFIFFKLNAVDHVLQFHEYVKSLSQLTSIEELMILKPKDNRIKLLVYSLKMFSLDDNALFEFLSSKKMNMETFTKLAAILVAKIFRVNISDLVITENQTMMLNDISSYLNKKIN